MEWWVWGLLYLTGGCLTMCVWWALTWDDLDSVVAVGLVWPLAWLGGVLLLGLVLRLHLSRRW